MARADKRHGRMLLLENAIETATVTRSKVSTGMIELASEGTCPITRTTRPRTKRSSYSAAGSSVLRLRGAGDGLASAFAALVWPGLRPNPIFLAIARRLSEYVAATMG